MFFVLPRYAQHTHKGAYMMRAHITHKGDTYDLIKNEDGEIYIYYHGCEIALVNDESEIKAAIDQVHQDAEELCEGLGL